MISPHWWNLKRPGLLLPVFFLSLFLGRINGQISGQEASVSALGGSFVARTGHTCAIQNQAGLAWVENHSLSLIHSLPYLQLGVTSLGLQLSTERGAWGTSFSTYGIQGFRQSSTWVAYGMFLSKALSIGMGMHFWTSSIPEKPLYHPGFSLALGLQARINEQWIWGVHIRHPVGWNETASGQPKPSMTISSGCSYSFFKTATAFAELHVLPGEQIQWAYGLQWTLRKAISLMFGIRNQPLTWSAGISVIHKWGELQMAFQYVTETGSTPSISIHYDW